MKSTSTGLPESDDKVAVSITFVLEFSLIFSSLKVKATVGGSLMSVKLTVNAVESSKTAFVTEVFKIIVSSFSSLVSRIPENNNSATVSPDLITNCGEKSYFWTRLLSESDT